MNIDYRQQIYELFIKKNKKVAFFLLKPTYFAHLTKFSHLFIPFFIDIL